MSVEKFAHRAAVVALLALSGASSQAAEAYVATGFPYLLVGVAQPVTDSVTVRADWGTAGHHNYSGSTSDAEFRGSVNYNRAGLFADWFAIGSFRLTGGVTFNQFKTPVKASATGGQIVIGGVTYAAPSDQYYVSGEVSFPTTTPYLGLGFGHAPSSTGWSFHLDAGAALGTAKATALTASTALQSELALSETGAADLASASAKFQSEVKSLKAIPQITLGVSYRF